MPKRLEEEAIRVLSNVKFEDKKTWWDLINSRVFVTFLGGIAITIASIIIPHQLSKSDKELAIIRSNEKRKYDFLGEFGDGIARSLQISIGIRKREIWLKYNQKNKKKIDLIYADGRNFEDTRDFYEKKKGEFDKLRNPDSICAQAKVLFATKKTIQEIDKLDKILDDYFTTYNYRILNENFNKANTQYQEVIKSMGSELRK